MTGEASDLEVHHEELQQQEQQVKESDEDEINTSGEPHQDEETPVAAANVDSECESDDEWNYVKPATTEGDEEKPVEKEVVTEPAADKPEEEELLVVDNEDQFGDEEIVHEVHAEAQAIAESEEHCSEVSCVSLVINYISHGNELSAW